MGIEKNEFYVNNMLLTIWDNNLQKSLIYKGGQINTEVFNMMKECVNKNKLARLQMENTKTDLSITVFCENGLSHFGIIDMYNDVNYYYDSQTNDTTLVEIEGQLFEKWMVCENSDLLWEAIIFFAINGKCSPKIKWKEE